jgi:hypothetical protein
MPTILPLYPSQSYNSEHFVRSNVGSDARIGTAFNLHRFVLSRLNEDGRKSLPVLAGMVVVGRDRPLP